MNWQALTGNRIYKLLKATFDGFMEDNALRLSAALAYYSVFSIAPLLVIAISVAGLVLGQDAVRGELGGQLTAYVGAQAAESVQSMVQSASKPSDSWTGAVIGFVTLLVGASGVFGQLQDALNTIWEVRAKPGASVVTGFIRNRLLNFGMVLVIGFLLLTSLMLTTAVAALSKYLGDAAHLSPILGAIFGFIASLGVEVLLFAFIFKVLPDAQVRWRNVWIGALVTGLLFEVGKFGLSFYLGRESTASSFGAAGSVVLLLLWVYYASCILLFGAEFTQVYAKETGHQILPSAGAEAVTEEKRAQEGLAASKPGTTSPRPIVTTEIITVEARPSAEHPFGTLLAITAVSFLVGLLSRKAGGAPTTKPSAKIREGFAELGTDTVEDLAEAWRHWKRNIQSRVR